ncbi:2-epi-5-epi-valiolone 7-kinase [Actinoplanes sp. SE50]|uniref:2-epi-5-epi-valiolone 7-kinase n=1 Tax=Actinoplanes sp. (strain ATCC 31044 / CBS 674.73 / SE50/110) TaxID=134676 RepID=ACBM_ACTS5|nr:MULTISPECIES: 2-epi-5-epi-valiolone 7-kinase [unclassified Actinoplanes]Q8RIS8.2 RecName: Full=2-epi-5-epi-valiolone 7-kinase [Actinoplanes sp. SE50/110]AEV84571.1 2-epi-5-epi-valiolone 7-kinase [Actinoplanes sp. SE50/110]ATO82963.1 2-epi-5-epi-valiolone 7-kinase [Actinoplanes sp. SE50]CAD29482.2 2-epi-5-epi-valiolone 7-kinase AcbM [Actinoplanes sp. SE50/110]SLM00371.1 2-epi-5-epi-valiolone 7-kinase [Actinoplanes sp. SE50/110]
MKRPPHHPVTVADVGGTHLRWARWSPDGGLGEVHTTPSPGHARRPGAGAADLQAELIRELASRVEPGARAGVSLGAAMDHHSGTAYASAPLWGPQVSPFDVPAALRAARPDVHWTVVNDVTAGLLHLAEMVRDAGVRKACLVTISTGIACRTMDLRTGGIPVDAAGLQGEIGHLPATVLADGVPVVTRCDCGEPGHVAASSSGPGIRRVAAVLARRDPATWAGSGPTTRMMAGSGFEDAFRAALDDGDPVAADLLTAVTAPIADLLRTALCLDPELDLIALTGGVAHGLEPHYSAAVHDHLRRRGLYLTSEREPDWLTGRIRVVPPATADPLVGAGLAALAAGPVPAYSGGGREALVGR